MCKEKQKDCKKVGSKCNVRLQKVTNKCKSFFSKFARRSSSRTEIPTNAKNLDWNSYEDLHYEQVFPGNGEPSSFESSTVASNAERCSSGSSSHDSGVNICKQIVHEAVQVVSQNNKLHSKATVDSTDNGVVIIASKSEEGICSKYLSNYEVYSSVQKPEKKSMTEFQQDLDKIEIVDEKENEEVVSPLYAEAPIDIIIAPQIRMSRRKSRLKKLINKLRNWCHIFRRDSTLRNEVPVSAMNKLEWVSYEDIMYEEVRFNNDELSSHASTDDSGVIVGKQEIVPTQSNVIITNAIIENHEPKIYSNLVSARANEENILETNSTERGTTIEDTIKRVQETPTNSIYSIVQKRQKTNPGLQEHLDYIETISNKSTKLSQYVDDGLESREYHSISDDFLSCPRANSDDIFYTLKKMRDIECVRLNQSSNILKAVIEKPERDWKEQLLAETILLENELRYQLIANKIRGLNDHTTVDQHKQHTIDLSLTNFEFEVQQHCPKKNRTTEFFVLAVSHNMELFVTKAIAPVDNKLVFTDKFTFKHMLDCFRVKIEVYSIKLRTEKSMVNTLWKKNTRTLCPIFRIYYENVHTYELHESKILKPSYSLCGAVTVTKENIGNNDFTFSPMMANSSLCMYLNATVFVEKVNLKTNVAGFLAVGKTNGDNNVIYWDRKWCTLRGCEFSIYNYPQDEVFNKPPLANVNLEYCLEKLAFNRSTSKRRSFVLKTGRPSTLEDKNQVNLKYKNNFVIDKYFLAADNSDDFKIWTEELNSALEFLAEWDKLIFGDDYYLIS